MAILGAWSFTFSNGVGVGSVIDATQMMANFDQIKVILNALDDTNLTLASKVAVIDRAKTWTAIQTFTANPVFAANAIADAALSTNVVLKNANSTITGNNTFSGNNTFQTPVAGLQVPELASHPTTVGDAGKIYKLTAGGYWVWDGSAAKAIDYIGGYTGGAIRCYHGMQATDENSPIILMFRTDNPVGGFTAKLALKGFNFPSYIYTELPQHSHAYGTVAVSSVVTDAGHAHSVTVAGHGHTGDFGSSAHTHAGPSHTHTGPSHTHTGPSHTHTGPSHQHALTGASAAASASLAHTHTGPSHAHLASGTVSGVGDHSHSFGGTTGSGGSHAHTAAAGGDATSTNGSHDHNYSGTSGNGGAHNHTYSDWTSGDGTQATGSALTTHTHALSGSVDAGGTGATGAEGTGATGSEGTGATSASGTGTTGGPSATASTGTATLSPACSSVATGVTVASSVSGSTAVAGLLGNALGTIYKTVVDPAALKVYVSDTPANWTHLHAAYQAADWAALTNVNANLGTGDIDITAACIASSTMWLKICDETAHKGGSLTWMIETY